GSLFFHRFSNSGNVDVICALDVSRNHILSETYDFIRGLIINIKELSPAASDMDMVLDSIQSSNEGESQGILSVSDPKLSQTRKEGLPFAPEAQELADTGSCPVILLLHENLIASSEETDGSFSCYLDLTLASAPLPDKPASQMAKTISNGASGVELMEQVTERVSKVSVNGGMKVEVEESDMTL
ncbi:LOW QUALITY PROTEIN: hypothetical protein HID58_067972, partial [Brassica napus]